MSCMGHNELLIKANKQKMLLAGFCSLLAMLELLSRESTKELGLLSEFLARKQNQAGGPGHCGDG